LMLAFAAALLLLTRRLAAATGGNEVAAVAGVALAPLLLGALVRNHFDLAPVALTAGALLALVLARPRLGLGLLGAGAMTKLFPLAAAPVALAWLAGRGERRSALRGGTTLAIVLAAGVALAVARSPSGPNHASSSSARSARWPPSRPSARSSRPNSRSGSFPYSRSRSHGPSGSWRRWRRPPCCSPSSSSRSATSTSCASSRARSSWLR